MPDPTKRMDRAEIARRVERAEKLLQKGKTGEALDEYMQVLAEDPQNDNVRQMAADICLSLQRTAEAVKLLGDLFERQIAAGENTRRQPHLQETGPLHRSDQHPESPLRANP